MKITKKQGSFLPSINLKKFDEVQKTYQSSLQKLSLSSVFKSRVIGQQKLHQQLRLSRNRHSIPFARQFQSLKDLSLLISSKRTIQYKNMPVSFFKNKKNGLGLVNVFNPQTKANLRQIDKKTVLEKTSRLEKSRSVPQLNAQQIVNYQNWIPKKIKSKQLKTKQISDVLKSKQIESSFFLKCRSNKSVLKLSQNPI